MNATTADQPDTLVRVYLKVMTRDDQGGGYREIQHLNGGLTHAEVNSMLARPPERNAPAALPVSSRAWRQWRWPHLPPCPLHPDRPPSQARHRSSSPPSLPWRQPPWPSSATRSPRRKNAEPTQQPQPPRSPSWPSCTPWIGTSRPSTCSSWPTSSTSSATKAPPSKSPPPSPARTPRPSLRWQARPTQAPRSQHSGQASGGRYPPAPHRRGQSRGGRLRAIRSGPNRSPPRRAGMHQPGRKTHRGRKSHRRVPPIQHMRGGHAMAAVSS